MAATSLLDVAKAMNSEAAGSSGKLSLLDVAKQDVVAPAEGARTKPATLMDVAKQEAHSSKGDDATKSGKPTLQQLAQEIDKEDRSTIQKVLDTTAKEVKAERQELREETLKQAAVEVQQEEQQAAQALRAKVTAVKTVKLEVANQIAVKTEEDVDGYSSFGEEEEPSPKEEKQATDPADTVEESAGSVADSSTVSAGSNGGKPEPPPQTTPSDSKESKEFLRTVYRADKYRVRDMLDEDVDVNIADQHGWSGLHWAASQNHGDILALLLQKGAQVNAVDQMNGWTALHVAVVREALACIKILLMAGADARIKDAYGDTVVDCLQAANGKKKAKMLQLLQEFRANNKR